MGANSFTRLAGPTTPARRERQREARAPTPFAPSHVQVAYRPATACMVRVSPGGAVLATATGSAAGIRFRNSSTGHQQHCPSHVGSPLLAMLHFAARFPRSTQRVRSYVSPAMRSAPPLTSKHSIASAPHQLQAEWADGKSSFFTFPIRPFFCPLDHLAYRHATAYAGRASPCQPYWPRTRPGTVDAGCAMPPPASTMPGLYRVGRTAQRDAGTPENDRRRPPLYPRPSPARFPPLPALTAGTAPTSSGGGGCQKPDTAFDIRPFLLPFGSPVAYRHATAYAGRVSPCQCWLATATALGVRVGSVNYTAAANPTPSLVGDGLRRETSAFQGTPGTGTLSPRPAPDIPFHAAAHCWQWLAPRTIPPAPAGRQTGAQNPRQ